MAAGRSLSTESTSLSPSLMAATEEDEDDGDGYTLPLFFIFIVSLDGVVVVVMREEKEGILFVWWRLESERGRREVRVFLIYLIINNA